MEERMNGGEEREWRWSVPELSNTANLLSNNYYFNQVFSRRRGEVFEPSLRGRANFLNFEATIFQVFC
jgi:hypothetical protein